MEFRCGRNYDHDANSKILMKLENTFIMMVLPYRKMQTTHRKQSNVLFVDAEESTVEVQ